MNSHDQRIWAYSILFLSIFRPLQYNRVSLNMLLFRDFQRFYKKHAKRLPRTSVRPVSPRKLHLSCAPYLRYKTPQMCNPDGYTLIRANLYSVVHNIRQERVIFLAHTRKEMITMRKIAGCRPLIYLPKLKPV